MTLRLHRSIGRGGAVIAALPLLLALSACQVTERQVRQGAEIDALEARLLRLERAREERQTAPTAQAIPQDLAQRLADLGQQVQALDEDVRDLTGRVDTLETRPATPPAATGATPDPELARLTQRVEELETRAQAPVAVPAPPASVPSGTSKKPAPRDLYNDAYAKYKSGKYDEARAGFRQYIEAYPDTNLTDNAHFWLGECYYDQEQYEKAILAYDKVIQNFPTGDKVASALLKQAFAFDAIGDPVDARILLQKLLREHPSAEQTDIARKKLEILGE